MNLPKRIIVNGEVYVQAAPMGQKPGAHKHVRMTQPQKRTFIQKLKKMKGKGKTKKLLSMSSPKWMMTKGTGARKGCWEVTFLYQNSKGHKFAMTRCVGYNKMRKPRMQKQGNKYKAVFPNPPKPVTKPKSQKSKRPTYAHLEVDRTAVCPQCTKAMIYDDGRDAWRCSFCGYLGENAPASV